MDDCFLKIITDSFILEAYCADNSRSSGSQCHCCEDFVLWSTIWGLEREREREREMFTHMMFSLTLSFAFGVALLYEASCVCLSGFRCVFVR